MTNYYKLTVPNDGTQTRFSIPASKAIFFKSATLADAETETVKVILSKGANDVSGAFIALKGLIINDTDFDTITLSNDGSDTATVELFTSEGSFKFAGATSGGTATIPNPLEDTALKNPGAITQDNGNALEISATGANVDISGEQVTAGNNTLYASDAGMVKLMTSDEKTGIRMLGGVQAFTRIDGEYLAVPEIIRPAVSGSSISFNDSSFAGAGPVNIFSKNYLSMYCGIGGYIDIGASPDEIPFFQFHDDRVEGSQQVTATMYSSNEGGWSKRVSFGWDYSEYDNGFYDTPFLSLKGFKYVPSGTSQECEWTLKIDVEKKVPILVDNTNSINYIFDPDTGTFKKETT